MTDISIMARKTIAMSVQGDREFAKAVKAVAAVQGFETAAEFVRKAIDTMAGDAIRDQMALFVAMSDGKFHQIKETANDHN
jgi:hypothetical protein